MALPSQTVDQNSVRPASKGQKVLINLMEEGENPTDIARRKYPKAKDKKKRQLLRQKLWNQLNKVEVQREIAERVQAGAMAGLIGASDGLATRAARKTDAAKLLFEMTGVHTPRSRVEHSGEVKISLNIPRPTFEGQEIYDDHKPIEDPDEA